MSKDGAFKSEDVDLSYERFFETITKLINKGIIKKKGEGYHLTDLGKLYGEALVNKSNDPNSKN